MSNKPRQKLDPKKFTPPSESQPKKDRDWTYDDILRSKSRRRGFTLMEIIIVTMIAGVLASIAYFNYSTVVEKARAKVAENMIYALWTQDQSEAIENNGVPYKEMPIAPANENCGTPVEGFGSPICSMVVHHNPPPTPVYARGYFLARLPPAPAYVMMAIYAYSTTGVNQAPFQVVCISAVPNLCSKLGY